MSVWFGWGLWESDIFGSEPEVLTQSTSGVMIGVASWAEEPAEDRRSPPNLIRIAPVLKVDSVTSCTLISQAK